MDEQRLENLLECGEGASCGNLYAIRQLRAELAAAYEVGAAFDISAKTARERAESAEAEVRSLREERDAIEALLDERCSFAAPRLKSGVAARVRMTVDAMHETRKALIARAESAESDWQKAEVELQRLREGMRQKLETAWLAGARWQGSMVNHPIGARVRQKGAAMKDEVDRLLASPVEEVKS
jgi:hypothetical protein